MMKGVVMQSVTPMSKHAQHDSDDLDDYKDRIEEIVEERRNLFDRLA